MFSVRAISANRPSARRASLWSVAGWSGVTLALLLLGTACRTTPEPALTRIEFDLEQPWLAIADESDDTETGLPWPGELTAPDLNALFLTAISENRDLRAAAARLRQELARTRALTGDRRPSVDAAFNASRRGSGTAFEGPRGDTGAIRQTHNRFDLLLRLDWELDVWGRLADAASGAAAESTALEADLEGARLSLTTEIARLYFRSLHARERQDLQERQSDRLRATLRVVQDRILTGFNRGLDGRQVEARLAQSEAAEKAVAREEREIRQRLQVLLGRSTPWEGPSADASLPGLQTPPPGNISSSQLTRRPDLIAAEARLAAADFRLGEARKRLIPSLRLTAEAGTGSHELEDLLRRQFSVWALAGSLLQPIYRGGQLREGVIFVEEELRARLAEFEGTLLSALAEIDFLLRADTLIGGELLFALRALEAAEAAETLAAEQYQRGLLDVLAFLETQGNRYETAARLLDLKLLRLENRLSLHLALGGDLPESAASSARQNPSSP
jgi:multidrug efflux system outer membrane protein